MTCDNAHAECDACGRRVCERCGRCYEKTADRFGGFWTRCPSKACRTIKKWAWWY